MNELDFTPYSSAFPRFLPSLALHPMDETAQSRRAYDCWSQLHFVPPYPWIQDLSGSDRDRASGVAARSLEKTGTRAQRRFSDVIPAGTTVLRAKNREHIDPQ
jgi:hypothetical protein